MVVVLGGFEAGMVYAVRVRCISLSMFSGTDFFCWLVPDITLSLSSQPFVPEIWHPYGSLAFSAPSRYPQLYCKHLLLLLFAK